MKTRGVVGVGKVMLLASLLLGGSGFGLAGLGVTASAQVPANDPLRANQWPLDVIGAEVAWEQSKGAGMTVAVIDTGVDLAHEDLKSQIVAGNDFIDGDGLAQDVNGHGTHVAGVIAAAAGNGLGLVGVAPEARVMPIRALDAEGSGTPTAVVAAVNWAIDNGANVINLSVTEVLTRGGSFTSSLTSAIQRAWDKGVIVVLASGNDDPATSISFPSYDTVPAIVVTATDRNDALAAFAKPVGNARWALAAPGGSGRGQINDDIASTFWMRGQSNLYAAMAGTSMAVPHVAGAAALLRSMGLSPAETVDRLLATARDLGPVGRDTTFGAGRLDLSAAINGVPQSLQQSTIVAPVDTNKVVPDLIPVTSVLNPVIEAPVETAPSSVAKSPRVMDTAPELPPPETSQETTSTTTTKPKKKLMALSTPGGSRPSQLPATMAASLAIIISGSACWKSRNKIRRPHWS